LNYRSACDNINITVKKSLALTTPLHFENPSWVNNSNFHLVSTVSSVQDTATTRLKLLIFSTPMSFNTLCCISCSPVLDKAVSKVIAEYYSTWKITSLVIWNPLLFKPTANIWLVEVRTTQFCQIVFILRFGGRLCYCYQPDRQALTFCDSNKLWQPNTHAKCNIHKTAGETAS